MTDVPDLDRSSQREAVEEGRQQRVPVTLDAHLEAIRDIGDLARPGATTEVHERAVAALEILRGGNVDPDIWTAPVSGVYYFGRANRWAAFTDDELKWIAEALDFDDEVYQRSLRHEIKAEIERRQS